MSNNTPNNNKNQDHESFEAWLFSEENEPVLVFFIICVSFAIWYFFHISNLAMTHLAGGN